MEDEREKFNKPADKGDEVEGHKFDPAEAKHEKFQAPAEEEGDDVEGHKFEPAQEKFNAPADEGDDDVEAHKF